MCTFLPRLFIESSSAHVFSTKTAHAAPEPPSNCDFMRKTGLYILFAVALVLSCPAQADGISEGRETAVSVAGNEAPLLVSASTPVQVRTVEGAAPPVAQALPAWWVAVDRPADPPSNGQETPDE